MLFLNSKYSILHSNEVVKYFLKVFLFFFKKRGKKGANCAP
nr:MAG TPA: hypothetical protein [Caudoviricetes sp.]